MNILVPSIPGPLRITPTMRDDFLCDPVLGAKVLMGVEMDYFQRARLRQFWWTPFMIDSSGFSSGKTIVDFVFICQRVLLLPDHDAGVFYYKFDQGKQNFWPYFDKIGAKIFRAHLGRVSIDGDKDKKGSSAGSGVYQYFFKSGGKVVMPAPGFIANDGAGNAGLRFNTLLLEEYTHIEAASDGIYGQLIGRVTKPSWNQEHPIWCNHILMTATAKTQGHPSHKRIREYEREIKRGNPRYGLFSANYKHYSRNVLVPGTRKTYAEMFRIQSVIDNLRKGKNGAEFLGEGLGIWSRNSRGWYSEEMVLDAVQLGRNRKLRPVLSKSSDDAGSRSFYFLGGDPAPAQSIRSDDGALMVLRATPMVKDGGFSDNPADWICDFVMLRRVRRTDAGQWAGLIHGWHQRYGFSNALLDWGGGGQWIRPELAKGEAVIEGVRQKVTPIVEVDNGQVVDGHFILHFTLRRDPGIKALFQEMAGDDVLVQNLHTEFRTALMNRMVGIPAPAREHSGLRELGEECQFALKNFEQFALQLQAIQTETDEEGNLVMTRNNALSFFSSDKKDFVTAGSLAWVAFLMWLKNDAAMEMDSDGDDSSGFSG